MKKSVLSRFIISAIGIGAILALVLFTSCADSNSKKVRKKYVTDYDIEVNDEVYTKNNWHIQKKENYMGDVFLYIDHDDKYRSNDSMKKLAFSVYDSVSDARKSYDHLYRTCKNGSGFTKWEEGVNWFISDEPEVYDSFITWMVCQKGNIIIEAELSIFDDQDSGYDYFSETDDAAETAKDAKSPQPTTTIINAFPLRYYIIDNTKEIKHYVLDVILKEKIADRY